VSRAEWNSDVERRTQHIIGAFKNYFENVESVVFETLYKCDNKNIDPKFLSCLVSKSLHFIFLEAHWSLLLLLLFAAVT
jgi:hypothetical protein